MSVCYGDRGCVLLVSGHPLLGHVVQQLSVWMKYCSVHRIRRCKSMLFDKLIYFIAQRSVKDVTLWYGRTHRTRDLEKTVTQARMTYQSKGSFVQLSLSRFDAVFSKSAFNESEMSNNSLFSLNFFSCSGASAGRVAAPNFGS